MSTQPDCDPGLFQLLAAIGRALEVSRREEAPGERDGLEFERRIIVQPPRSG